MMQSRAGGPRHRDGVSARALDEKRSSDTTSRERWLIGGDFELSFSPPNDNRLEQLTKGRSGTWTLSGRAALAMVLTHLRDQGVTHVHLPSYLCQSIVQPVDALGFERSFYPVRPDLTAEPDPPRGAAVLIIHYFGWLNPVVSQLRAEAGGRLLLIEDASQALLSDWGGDAIDGRFVILSPRKFGPVPMAGWCNVAGTISPPSPEAEVLAHESVAARRARAEYLAVRNGGIDLAFERSYLQPLERVEAFLDSACRVEALPSPARRSLAAVDWAAAAVARRKNWWLLHELLSPLGLEAGHDTLPPTAVPLGYVVRMAGRDRVRAELAAARIFCPVHWPPVAGVPWQGFPTARMLCATSLTLPIDQRYGAADMHRMARELKAAL